MRWNHTSSQRKRFDRDLDFIITRYHEETKTASYFLKCNLHSHSPVTFGLTFLITNSLYNLTSTSINSWWINPSWNHYITNEISLYNIIASAPQTNFIVSPVLATRVFAAEVTVTAFIRTKCSMPVEEVVMKIHTPWWCGAQLYRKMSSLCTSTLIKLGTGEIREYSDTGGGW